MTARTDEIVWNVVNADTQKTTTLIIRELQLVHHFIEGTSLGVDSASKSNE
jgi:hypothetical protein